MGTVDRRLPLPAADVALPLPARFYGRRPPGY
ncbi:hypothetical protein PR002_g18781 [Phytophthora rubi]|uniref:Uncharacterized protein n=1 Tax=Phytophthora rubi TaxID=129364 RepID=A0A6A3K2L3_9STRA|nr:hypothetical protein PR002_g18781 [Phytophthora rubi]